MKRDTIIFIVVAITVVGIAIIGLIFLTPGMSPLPAEDFSQETSIQGNELDSSKRIASYKTNLTEEESLKVEDHPYIKAMKEKEKIDWEEYSSKIKSVRPEDRQEAYWVLRYSETNFPLNKVYKDLERGIKEESPDVREAAVEALCQYTEDAAALPLFESVIDEKNPDDKENVLQALFNMQWNGEVERVVAKALFDKNEDVRDLALGVINNSIDDDSYDDVESAQKKYENFEHGGL